MIELLRPLMENRVSVGFIALEQRMARGPSIAPGSIDGVLDRIKQVLVEASQEANPARKQRPQTPANLEVPVPAAKRQQGRPKREPNQTESHPRRQPHREFDADQYVAEHYEEWKQRWPDLFGEQTPKTRLYLSRDGRATTMSLNENGARLRRLGVVVENDYNKHAMKRDPLLPSQFWKRSRALPDYIARRKEWWRTLPNKLRLRCLRALPFDDSSLEPLAEDAIPAPVKLAAHNGQNHPKQLEPS
jgi:hypothetical protein